MLGFAAVWLSMLPAQAADPSCEYFKTNAPILDVLKDPNKVGDYVGELQRGDVVCISQKRKIGRRTWGLVKHVRLDGGKTDKLGGWVGLRFMKPHKLSTSDAAPETTAPIRKAAPSPYTPTKQAPTKSKAELDREGEIAYWNTVRESKDPELIESYLAQYPNGDFAKLARLMLDKMDRGGDRAGSKQYEDDAPKAKPRDRKVSKPSRSEQRRASERRSEERARAEQRRNDRDRAERRRRDRARQAERRRDRDRRAERRREKQARDRRRRAHRDRPRRQRTPRCRMETRFECIKRGGTINSSGDCNLDRICRLYEIDSDQRVE